MDDIFSQERFLKGEQDPLLGLVSALGYRFKDRELLDRAFRHASYVNESPDCNGEDNERLEFLGDAVLNLAVGTLLMERFPQAHEGDLSRYRAMLVDEAALHQVALRLGLGRYVRLGKGEEQSGGREKPSILADLVEALLGAVYLDGGFSEALSLVTRLMEPQLRDLGNEARFQDFKTLLQEYTQQHFRTLPRYRVVKETGPPHDPTFETTVSLNGEVLARGSGKSKKEAEQRAAQEAWHRLTQP